MAFDKSPGPVEYHLSILHDGSCSSLLLMSKRVTKAMSRIATSLPKTLLAINAAGATFLKLFIEMAKPVGAKDVACLDVLPLDVLHEELHRLSLLGVADSGNVPDFVTVMKTG